MLKSIFLCLFLLFFAQIGGAQEVKSYEEAQTLSEKTNKQIFLYFGAEWCTYCKKMKAILEDKEVSEKMKDFIILKVDLDENKDLAKKYKVKSIPDYMIIHKDEVLKRNVGYKDKNEFISWLKN